jgi:D-sedoheptulose 7-phosphate isomerase
MLSNMEHQILTFLEESIAVKDRTIRENLTLMVESVEKMAMCLTSGHKILLFGNGGSAADAQHLAAEFVNRFRIERPPLAALALTTDTSILTSISNDYHFDDIFSKQIQALGGKDDIAWGFSTSGNSKNVIKGIDTAKEAGIFTLGMSGHGGELAARADRTFCVKSNSTARIQETHITIGHILCDLVDQILFP